MRGRILGKIGLVIVYAACTALLMSCLVGSGSKPKTYKITTAPSSNMPIYTNGQYISMQYESYLVGGSPQSPGSGITMSWRDSILPLPFINLGSRSALRFAFEDLGGTAVQYIKQDATGSIFLHAFEGIGSSIPGSQTHMFWPNKSTSLTASNPPSPVQIFWSPIEEGTHVDRAIGGALDFNIVGECNTACNSIGNLTASSQSRAGLEVTSDTIQVVTTPLGNFETYNIRYAGTLAVTNYPSSVTATVGFDYRASCLRPGQNGTASFEGEMWIYPPIGAVKIRNYCVPSVGIPISYTALITATNLPF